MGFNFGAFAGGLTEGAKSTYKLKKEQDRFEAEEARRKEEHDYLKEQRQKEKDYNTAIAGLPGVGEQYNFDQTSQGMRPPEPIGATYTQSPTMPAALDSSLEGAPAGALPAAGEVVRTRKVTQGDLYHMQAAAARKAGYGDKALEFSRQANQEDLRGARALLLKSASTGGWEGLDEVMGQINDGHKLERKQNKDGTWTIKYGGGQDVIVGSAMQAALLASAAIEGDPEHFGQYLNQFADQDFKNRQLGVQESHYGRMADLQRQEIEANQRYRDGMLRAEGARNDLERQRIEATVKPEKEFADLSRRVFTLMQDPYGNARELSALNMQIASRFPDKVMVKTKNVDGEEVLVNSLDQMTRSASKEREQLLMGNPLFASGDIYLDPLKGGYRVRGLEAQGVRFTDWNSAVQAAQSLKKQPASGTAVGTVRR